MPPTGSVQGKCRSGNSNNSKDGHDLGQIIIQNYILFWFTGKQEEVILLV